jgi:hypothetical protein
MAKVYSLHVRKTVKAQVKKEKKKMKAAKIVKVDPKKITGWEKRHEEQSFVTNKKIFRSPKNSI